MVFIKSPVSPGYSRADRVNELYARNADEFTDDMTALVKEAAKKFPSRVAVGLDARDGKVIERRTATQDEIDESRSPKKSQTGMFGSTQAADDIVLVSLNTARYEKTKRAIADGLLAVRYPNQEADPDGDELSIHWKVIDGRSVAEVPRWAADRLKKIADGDKALDFKIGDLAKLAEKLSSDGDSITITVGQ